MPPDEPGALYRVRRARDRSGLVTWYEEQSVGLGSRLLDDILDARNRIAAFPRAWPQLGDGVRRFTRRHFPYGFVYIATEDEVIVVGLGHLHRGPEFWQSMTRRRD